MSNSFSKKSMVPKLRFSNFYNSWNETSLKDITSSFLKGRGISKEDIVLDGKNECIRYGELYTTYDEIISSVSSRTNVSASGSILSKNGDLLFPSSGETAADIARFSALLKDDVILSGDLNILRLKEDYHAPFFAYYLSHFKRGDIAKFAQGNSVVHLYNASFEEIKIRVPNFEEQKEISGFFNGIDLFIKNLEIQKTKLEEHKKGMVQKIFSQEVRFKDERGKSFPSWKKVRMGDIFKRKAQRNSDNRCKDVLTNSAARGIVNQRDYFEKDIANQDNLLNYHVVDVNDFVYNPRISSLAPVGPLKRNKSGRGIMSPLYTILTLSKGNLGFYEYYFDTNLWHRYMYMISNFGARHDRMNIRDADLMKVPLPFPVEKEQEQIAEFLDSIGGLIKTKMLQIENAKAWKRGLLQKMFV